MTEPKCPLKFHLQAFEGGEECDEGCAWLMKMNDVEQYRMCAFALIARKQAHGEWIPVNYWNEVDI